MSNKTPICSFCNIPKERDVLIHNTDKTNNIYICEQCIRKCYFIIEEENKENDIIENINIDSLLHFNRNAKQVKEELDQYVIGQDDAKKRLAVAICDHIARLKSLRKNKDKVIEKANLLMIGPTGCGKTLLAQRVATLFALPFVSVDATTLTETGYVGDDVENILIRLIQAADYDIAKAEMGIVYIDEIDKLARKNDTTLSGRDISGEGVQQSLLKMLEGTTVFLSSLNKKQHTVSTSDSQQFKIDTSNILFICGGAFVGLNNIINKRINKNKTGFIEGLKKREDIKDVLSKYIRPDDLVVYGLIREFIGRLTKIAVLNELSREELVQILTKPKNAILKQYNAMLEADNIKLHVADETLNLIADETLRLNIGARGLRSVIDDKLVEFRYNADQYYNKSVELVVNDNITNIVVVKNKNTTIKKTITKKI